MTLKKLTHRVVFGSTLLQHYGRDISDTSTSSSSLTRWGESIAFTPKEDNSHIEIIITGSVRTSSNMTTTARYGNLAIRVNNVDEYVMNGVMGGRTNQAGTRHWHNPRHRQHNGRQQFHYSNFGNAVYANHIYQCNNANELTIECMVSCDNGQFNLEFKDGFLTVSEISNHGKDGVYNG